MVRPGGAALDEKVADVLVVDLQDGQRDGVVHLFVRVRTHIHASTTGYGGHD